MHLHPATWITRLLWASLPLTLGDLVASSLSDRSGAVSVTGAVLAWSVWAAVMVSSLVTLPVALLVMRILAPLSVVGGAVAATGTTPSPLGWAGLVTAVVVTVVALSAEVGLDAINGAAYGDERRFPLRPPVPLLLGPLPAVWVLTAVPLPLAALLAAAGEWVVAVPLAAAGAATAWWGVRVLARLTRRWAVLVPAGLTLVDAFALADPVLCRTSTVLRLGPAPVDTTATDLSVGAAGLILQIDLREPVEVTPVVRRGASAVPVSTTAILLAPSRPGRLLGAAAQRRIGQPV